jgi:hypothetical protein
MKSRRYRVVHSKSGYYIAQEWKVWWPFWKRFFTGHSKEQVIREVETRKERLLRKTKVVWSDTPAKQTLEQFYDKKVNK